MSPSFRKLPSPHPPPLLCDVLQVNGKLTRSTSSTLAARDWNSELHDIQTKEKGRQIQDY